MKIKKTKMKIMDDKKLYKITAIEKAIKQFEHLAEFNIDKRENVFVVSVANIDKDVANIFQDEFCNFVLHLMK